LGCQAEKQKKVKKKQKNAGFFLMSKKCYTRQWRNLAQSIEKTQNLQEDT
jgi:hypothetical protein